MRKKWQDDEYKEAEEIIRRKGMRKKWQDDENKEGRSSK